ncbi:hypothetical protein TELCIR_11733 [Teladorsagia circumcincta]|uniref:Peptidase A1 domain-containing protein n=1 Tax=Teladorsagia circumcincta TaxID=45464 RepID=A0A2G9U8H8_TELCI|nr:hypothetical protein TELCIR_11733 [Teladorsagia circumcincta]
MRKAARSVYGNTLTSLVKQKYKRGYEFSANNYFSEPLKFAPSDFDCDSSKTCAPTKEKFNITYGSGSVPGSIDHDVVCFGCGHAYCTNKTQAFGCALLAEGNRFAYYPFDGILGMAWPSEALKNTSPPVNQILENKVISIDGFQRKKRTTNGGAQEARL